MMIRVFDGGDGSTRGGRSERSRESGDLLPEDARERDGDGIVTCMLAVAIMYSQCVQGRGLVSSCCRGFLKSDWTLRESYIKRAAAWRRSSFRFRHAVELLLRSGAVQLTAKAPQSVRILDPPSDDSRLLTLGPLGLGRLAQPAADKPNTLLLCCRLQSA